MTKFAICLPQSDSLFHSDAKYHLPGSMSQPPNREGPIVDALLELPPERRGPYLEQACARDPRLRQLVSEQA